MIHVAPRHSRRRFLALAAGAGCAASPWPGSAMAAAGGDARLVDIGGGRRLYMDCRGTDGPTVIVEAGYRSRADVWTDDLIQPEAPRTMVLPGIAAFTRV